MKYLLFFVLLFSGMVSADTDVVDRAKRMNEMVAQKMGSSKEINDNYMKPMSTGSEMTTLDGSKSFKAQMTCQSSGAFLRMTLQPLQSGDVKIISIEQDLRLTGKIDAFTTPPWIISGVCANGFIQCKPGTWKECKASAWDVGEDNVLTAKEVAFSDLGGCYCINNNCGTGLAWSNLNSVLSNLGGGAAGALAKRNPFFSIGDLGTTNTSITYYGQNRDSCKTSDVKGEKYGTSPSELVGYQKNQDKLRKDAFVKQGESTLWHKLKNGQMNPDVGNTFHQCAVKREVHINETNLNDIIGYESGTGGVSVCGPDCLMLTLGQVGDNYWGGKCAMYQHQVRFYVKKPERIISATLQRAVWDDWIQIHANGQYIWSGPFNNWTDLYAAQPGKCELGTSWDQYPNVDFTKHLQKKGSVDFRIRVEVTGGGEGYASAMLKVDTSCHLEKDQINDSCQAYRADRDCTLVEEKVDGVFTFRNSAGTGLSPVVQEKRVSGSTCSFDVKRDWFNKERRYLCRKKGKYNFDEILKRKAHVSKTATETGYEDRILDENANQPSFIKGGLSLSEPINVPACTQSCKTRRPRPQHDASVSGITGGNSVQPITYDFFYHECKNDNVCSIGEGEEIIKQCQCIDEFAEATAMMQAMRMAGQDIVCSSGKSQNMDGS